METVLSSNGWNLEGTLWKLVHRLGDPLRGHEDWDFPMGLKDFACRTVFETAFLLEWRFNASIAEPIYYTPCTSKKKFGGNKGHSPGLVSRQRRGDSLA